MSRIFITATTTALLFCVMMISTVLAVGISWGADGGSDCNNPIYDQDGTTPLPDGDVVHLIWDQADDGIDSPDSNGNPTDDDQLLVTSTIGTGTFNSGCFASNLNTNSVGNGSKVYVRAFNDSTLQATTNYGNSPIFTIDSDVSFDIDATISGSFSTTSGPLTVNLASFTAISQPDHVLVDWATVAELGNLGFNVLRSTSPEGAQTRLNAELIPSQAPGSGQGASYSFEDDDVEGGTTYYYWLEDVDTSGTTTRHGPVSVTYESEPTVVQVIGLGNGSRGKPWANGLLGTLLLAAVGYLWYRRREPS